VADPTAPGAPVDWPVGQPLCLTSWSRERLLRRREIAEAGGAASVFGPACDGCALRPGCTGVQEPYAKKHGFEALRPFVSSRPEQAPAPAGTDASALVDGLFWEDRVRWLLTGEPRLSLRLGDVLPRDLLPKAPCTLPWRRLELHEGGTFGPCCAEYMTSRTAADADPAALWNGGVFQKFRLALAGQGHPATCRRSCPVLVGGLEKPENMTIYGGPAAFVENQIEAIRAMRAGAAEVAATPLELCVATTSYCNYDCLMCDCGARGTLDDQKPASFYEAVSPWLDRVSLFDANGGEPLASPEFRAFLARLDVSDREQLRFHLTTNGSYLTPSQLEKFGSFPLGSLTISLNAATPETYLAVNRGLPWERIRAHLDELLRLRAAGKYQGTITYSMVLLRASLAEIRAFAELGVRDRVELRYMLPMRNRSGQSIMVSRDAMDEARRALEDAARLFDAEGMARSAMGARASARVLDDRLSRRLLQVL
jgi:molybdenum cofactor biosynthesis enzyme MoaA